MISQYPLAVVTRRVPFVTGYELIYQFPTTSAASIPCFGQLWFKLPTSTNFPCYSHLRKPGNGHHLACFLQPQLIWTWKPQIDILSLTVPLCCCQEDGAVAKRAARHHGVVGAGVISGHLVLIVWVSVGQGLLFDHLCLYGGIILLCFVGKSG